ncbi:hypothetical protein ALC60_09311 [Trachymyrmex zeteki]|uniref:Uncharacterized protein n=1 Tax=Mycetomoellerius zeteki TaxID=64791 RepID=A0A151WV65_9HYME|nr:hypothetical protein ALC60_09311 [Trachymyrmex zeteki]
MSNTEIALLSENSRARVRTYREPQNSGTTGATTAVRVHSQATIVPHGREGSALLESVAIDSFAPLGWLVGVPSEAVRTMADPRGGRREKVKINENSSSAGAIEKLPGAARDISGDHEEMRKTAPHPLECSSPVDLAYNISCRLLFLLCRPIDRAGAYTRVAGKANALRRVSTVLKPENQLPITPLGKASTPRVRPTHSAFGDFKKIGAVDPLSGSRTGLSAGTRSLAQEDDTALSALWKCRISNTEIMFINS